MNHHDHGQADARTHTDAVRHVAVPGHTGPPRHTAVRHVAVPDRMDAETRADAEGETTPGPHSPTARPEDGTGASTGPTGPGGDAIGTPFRTPPRDASLPDPATDPLLSVIVLTLNEAENLEDAVRSLIEQEGAALEVLIVDGASTDGTVDIAKRLEEEEPGRVRLVASRDLPIGPARNVGLEAAAAPYIAFMSADATAAPGWAKAMAEALRHADIVYGRQAHTPPRLNVAAVVRGLRYHHFDDDATAPPETFASNVNAAIRREVFDQLRYVDEGPASALDDLLFTHEAKTIGMRIDYEPEALVRHKDATSLAGELAKNRREGYGWGILAPLLGLNQMVLAWGIAVLLGLVLFVIVPDWWTAVLLLGLVWAPALRRAVRSGTRFAAPAPVAFLGAVLVSPFFDLMFLLDYLRGLRQRRPDLTGRIHPQGA